MQNGGMKDLRQVGLQYVRGSENSVSFLLVRGTALLLRMLCGRSIIQVVLVVPVYKPDVLDRGLVELFMFRWKRLEMFARGGRVVSNEIFSSFMHLLASSENKKYSSSLRLACTRYAGVVATWGTTRFSVL